MAATETTSDTALRVEVRGGTTAVTLLRPEALNAISPAMLDGLERVLVGAAEDDAVERVVLDGAGGRAFCAGGDVRVLRELGLEQAQDFWTREYALNDLLAGYPKPVVSLLDGIVMGGGVGLGGHVALRVVTETTRWAMPEVRIGLTPDTGGSHLLAEAGAVGRFAAITANSIGGSDAIACGLADVFVPHDAVGALRDALVAGDDDVQATVRAFRIEPGPATLAEHDGWLATAFRAGSPSETLELLWAEDSEGARAAAIALERASPIAVAVTAASLDRARDGTLRAALEQELRAVSGLHARPDLREGIRARLVDRDDDPRWSPAALAEIDPAMVTAVLDTDAPAIRWWR